MKEFIVELWELRKLKLYSMSYPPLGKGGPCMLGNGKNGGSGKFLIVWLVGMMGVVVEC